MTQLTDNDRLTDSQLTNPTQLNPGNEPQPRQANPDLEPNVTISVNGGQADSQTQATQQPSRQQPNDLERQPSPGSGKTTMNGQTDNDGPS